MANVTKPYYKVTYNGVDITEDISDDVLSITYEDAIEGESNEVRILVDDMSGKWKNEWVTNVGSTISLEIGYSSKRLLNCGEFQIDEVVYSGQPDSVEIRCLSIGEDNSWRDEDSKIFVDQTVEEIVNHFAAKNNVEVVRVNGFAPLRDLIEQPLTSVEIGAAEVAYENRVFAMKIARVIQDREPDISFLYKFLDKWGVGFRLSPTKMHIFLKINYTPQAPKTIPKVYASHDPVPEGVYTGDRIMYNGELIDVEKNIQLFDYEIQNCSKNAVGGVDLRYYDPFGNEIFKKEVKSNELPRTLDDLKNLINNPLDEIRKRRKVYIDVDNTTQADIAAKAKLFDIISRQLIGEFNLDGAPEIVAGVAVPVIGLGELSGNYFVEKSFHRIDRNSGYTTRVDAKWISKIDS